MPHVASKSKSKACRRRRAQSVSRYFGMAILSGAAFYWGYRAGVMVGGPPPPVGQLEQPGPDLRDVVQTIQNLPTSHCQARTALDTDCPPRAPVTQAPIASAAVALVVTTKVPRRKPAPPPKPAGRHMTSHEVTPVGSQR